MMIDWIQPNLMKSTAAQTHQCHRALLLEEVLLRIFRYAPPHALAAAALTCRAWYDLALSALWTEVDVVNVLEVLGPTMEGDNGCLYFDEGFGERFTDRFAILAPKIKVVNKPEFHAPLHSSIVAEISIMQLISKAVSLLPNIQELNWNTNPAFLANEEAMYSLIFVGPTLRKFSMIAHQGTPPAAFFLRTPALCSDLTDLSLGCQNFDPETLDALASMLERLPALRLVELRLHGIPMDAGRIASALQGHCYLEDLHLDGEESSPVWWYPRQRVPFAALRRVRLAFGIIDSATFFDTLSAQSQLTHVQLGNAYEGVTAVHDNMQTVCRQTRLQYLRLQCSTSSDLSPRDVLKSIRPCLTLTTLSVVVRQRAEVGDADIALLVANLPLLQNFGFEMRTNPELRPVPGPTLQSFAIITSSCPDIRSITLGVDASRGVHVLEDKYPSHIVLSSVNVLESHIEDPRAVAEFFSRITTAQEFTISHEHLNFTYEAYSEVAKWEEVKALLPILRQARL